MEITKIDIIKFYTLYQHYNKLSNNIGVIGDSNRFRTYIKTIIKSFGKDKNKITIISNINKTKYTIIQNNIEYTYILIRNTDDLEGLYFKKFI